MFRLIEQETRRQIDILSDRENEEALNNHHIQRESQSTLLREHSVTIPVAIIVLINKFDRSC